MRQGSVKLMTIRSLRQLSAQQMIAYSTQKENDRRRSKVLSQQKVAKKLLKSGAAPVVHQDASAPAWNTVDRKVSHSSASSQILLSPSITSNPYNGASTPAISLSPVDQNEAMPMWENFPMGDLSSGMNSPNLQSTNFW